MSWLVDPLSLGFIQRALLAGSLAALIAALVGTWVVIRGLSFMGDALAHGVLPGIALGVVFSFDPTLGAVLSAFAMIAGINLVHRHSRLNEDTGIGLLFVGMLALGVVIISRGGSYAGSLTGILFGDALGVTTADIAVLASALAVAALTSAGLYRGFLALSFNEQKATMLGMRPRIVHIAMLSLVTMAVVTSFRTVGTLLVFGLLIAPPASAALVARRVPAMIGVACAYGVASVAIGLVASYHLDTAASATVAVVAVAAFFVTMAVKSAISS